MEWSRGPIIGRGSSATVSIAKTISGQVFAVKSTELNFSSSLQKEQSFLSQLSSPYIVKYVGSDITCENRTMYYDIFMEYMPGGTLADQIKKHGGSLEESLIKLYAHQLLKGLNYLHLSGIAHCDMKTQNILIGKDGIKIADLGCAKMVQEDNTIAGTPIFMAPEVARGEEQGFAADIWSLGCLIIEMATGIAPWSEMKDPVSALYRIGHSDDVIEIPSWLSINCSDFLSKCLIRNAKDRWTAEELLHHPFFDGIVEDNLIKLDEKLVQNSPTSTLDQSFWDPIQESVSDISSNTTFAYSDSPVNRIKKLVCSSDAELPNWKIDEDWLTVRGSFKEENPLIISQQNLDIQEDEEDLLNLELPSVLVAGEEELESSVNVEDLLLGQFTDRSSSSLDSYELVEHEIVSILLDFGKKNNKNAIDYSKNLGRRSYKLLFHSFYYAPILIIEEIFRITKISNQ